MLVCVVHIGSVRMTVLQAVVKMMVGTRFARRVINRVLMLVVRIVHMCVGMLHRIMNVFVMIVFGKMQPDAKAHQQSGSNKLRRYRFVQK